MNFHEKMQNLKAKINIVDVIGSYLPLIKKSKNYWVVCPFHEDSNPSMSISPEKQIYKCFSCGEQGNVFIFLQKYKKLSFNESVKAVATLAQINLGDFDLAHLIHEKESPKHPLKIINDLAANFFNYQLTTEDAKTAKFYLEKRKIDNNLINEFLIGYADKNNQLLNYLATQNYDSTTLISAGLAKLDNDGNLISVFKNRIVFPILDLDGSCLGFAGRTYLKENSKNAKYLNSPETEIFKKSKILYNLYNAKMTISTKQDYLYLVEGYMDVIALNKFGLKNCVALMGTNLTKDHCLIFKKITNNLIIFLDGDNAGKLAAFKILKVLLEHNFNIKIIKNDTHKDPDELVNNDLESLKNMLKNPQHPIEFTISFLLTKYEIKNDVFQLKLFLNELAPIYQTIKNPIELNFYLNELKLLTNFSEEQLKASLKISSLKLNTNDLITNKITITGKNVTYYEKLLELQKQLLMLLLLDRNYYTFLEQEKFVFIHKEALNLYFLIAQMYDNNPKLTKIQLQLLVDELQDNELFLFLQLILKKYSKINCCFNEEVIKDYLIKINNYLLEIKIEKIKIKIKETTDVNCKIKLLKKMSLLKNQKQ